MRQIAWLLVLLLAGCADVEPAEIQETVDERMMVIRGVVTTPELAPIAGANVTVEELNLTELTGPDGGFAFPPLPLDIYTVTADALDHTTVSITVSPGSNESLIFALEPLRETPRAESVHYEGHLQCAAEYLIIPGDCDRPVEEYGGMSLTEGTSIFEHLAETGWRSIVVDVVFDGQPSFDGLRVTVRGAGDDDQLTDYQDFAKFHGTSSYTFRMDAGESYPEGDRPVPVNGTQFLFDVFPQGHAWHTVCDPALGYGCFLGVGIGVDVKFDLYVTTFYVEPAPEGFTLQ